MIFIFIFFINSTYQNSFLTGNEFYRLPDYTKNNYHETYYFDFRDILTIDYDYIKLNSYFNITQEITPDTENTLKNKNIQVSQFQFDFKYKNILFSAGRILDFSNYEMSPYNGIKLNLYLKNFDISFIHGILTGKDDFLSPSSFYDITSSFPTYKINSIKLNIYNKSNTLSLKYIDMKETNENIKIFKSILNINFLNIKSYLYFNYLLSLKETEKIYFNITFKKFGAEYENYKPYFINNTIFNIFVRERYNRYTLYTKYKRLYIGIFNENQKYSGIKINFEYLNTFYGIEYLYKEYLLLKIRRNFIQIPKNTFNIAFNFFKNKENTSTALRASYLRELMQDVKIELHTDLLYNNFYKFQIRSGFYFYSDF